jgi:hypothetical protein
MLENHWRQAVMKLGSNSFRAAPETAVLRHTLRGSLRVERLELGRVLPFMWRMRMSVRCSSHMGKPPPLVSAQM